jgi:hypothetical protein
MEPSIAPRSFNKTEQEDTSGETKRKRRRSDEDVDGKEGTKKQKGHPRLPPQETIDLTGE